MKKALISMILVTAGLATSAAPAIADGRNGPVEVTNGRFQRLPHAADGVHDDIKGGAIMFRTAGHTTVYVRVTGLAPGATYPAHVHNQPCSFNPAGGGHYQQASMPTADPVNEIWPMITTDAKGHGTGHAVNGFVARPEAQSIVIHNPANTPIRLACVDLT